MQKRYFLFLILSVSLLGIGTQVVLGDADDFGMGTDSIARWYDGEDCRYGNFDSLKNSGNYPPENIFDNINGNLGTKIVGTSGNDLIRASNNGDTIEGKGGHDCIFGGSGDDKIKGGSGNDFILGLDGKDTLRGNFGNDIILGGNGNDLIKGGGGNDVLDGDSGHDICKILKGNDEYYSCEEF